MFTDKICKFEVIKYFRTTLLDEYMNVCITDVNAAVHIGFMGAV